MNGKLIIVVGRGHSGTRAMSHALSASGARMGDKLNKSGDLIPAGEMYQACRVFGRRARHLGGVEWDFSRVHAEPVDPKFERLVRSYAKSVLTSDAPVKGWKLPETTLVLPWIVRLFPDAYYIHWTRDPRDVILGRHPTDNLSRFGVARENTSDERGRRARSWAYQMRVVAETPAPKRMLTVRFEDFVLDQTRELRRLEDYLGFPMVEIPVRPEAVGRWRSDPDQREFPCLREGMERYGYE